MWHRDTGAASDLGGTREMKSKARASRAFYFQLVFEQKIRESNFMAAPSGHQLISSGTFGFVQFQIGPREGLFVILEFSAAIHAQTDGDTQRGSD
jgi:hypothetical protein